MLFKHVGPAWRSAIRRGRSRALPEPSRPLLSSLGRNVEIPAAAPQIKPLMIGAPLARHLIVTACGHERAGTTVAWESSIASSR